VTASGNTITFNSNCGTGAVTVESTNACASSPHANSTYDGHGSGGHGDSFADLDGDGDNEYVTRNNFTHYVTTYGPTGVTNQTFTGCHGVGAHGWTYTDVDGDGKQEYVTRTSSTHYITRYVGGACVSQTFTGGHGVGSHGWTYADIDGDGKQEYVTRTGGTHYITRYTATGLTNQTFTNCHGVGSTGWSYADVDGDGKQEYVTHSSGTFYISRYGATGCVNQTFTGGFGVGSDGWTFADVDGDGKQEYVTRNGGTHLVTRFTARGLLNQTITGCHGRGSDGWTYADVDGDGQSDYLTRTGSTHYRSRYTATGCVNESFLAHGSGTTGSTWVDIDGDRRADYVARSGGKHYVTRYGWRPDTLTSVTGMFGSTSTIAYKPATAWPNTNAVPASPTVASITTSDGRGTSSTTNYAYQGGLWSATERRFLGFRKVTTVVDAAGNYTETYYHQHVGCIAKPEATYFRNAAGQIFTYSSYSYAENAAPPYTSLLTQRWDYECNLDASCRRLVTTLGYDTYGNVTASYEYGDYDVAGDERTTTRGYYPNTAAYITGHPAYENVHAGIGTGGALKRQTLNTYDGGTTYAAAPGSRGLLTRRQRWLDQTGGYATRSFAYDAWGNRTSETDEVGATQTFTFDSTYRMYRTRRCDALNHCQATTYDVVLGGVTSDTDPNSKTHSRTYDALGRLATETPPMAARSSTSTCRGARRPRSASARSCPTARPTGCGPSSTSTAPAARIAGSARVDSSAPSSSLASPPGPGSCRRGTRRRRARRPTRSTPTTAPVAWSARPTPTAPSPRSATATATWSAPTRSATSAPSTRTAAVRSAAWSSGTAPPRGRRPTTATPSAGWCRPSIAPAPPRPRPGTPSIAGSRPAIPTSAAGATATTWPAGRPRAPTLAA
jgi:YD repeat-containing protein